MDRTSGTVTLLLLRAIPHVIIFLSFLVLWEISIILGWIDNIMIPKPTSIVGSIFKLYVTQGIIYEHFFITLCEAVLGFCIGATIAITLATISSLSGVFKRYVIPYAVVLNVTPGIALTPVVIAWFGYGMGSKIALGAIVSFFPIFVNTLTGLTQVDEERDELFRSLRANKYQMFFKMKLPGSLPMVFAGMKIGLTTALIGAIVAEFAQATHGVGVLMSRFSFKLDMASSIATLLSMTLIGLILFYFMEFLDDKTVFWRRENRLTITSRKRKQKWLKANSHKR